MFRRIRTVHRLIRLFLRCGSWRVARRLERENLSKTFLTQGDQDDSRLPLRQMVKTPWILDALPHIEALEQHAQASIRQAQDGTFRVNVSGLEFFVETPEELYILSELFVNCIYCFETSRPCVVIDVGMNVAFASLMFALRENVIKVYGYEPFSETYRQAIRNLELNPRVAGKVETKNVGLADGAREAVFEYCRDYRGSVGQNGLPERLRGRATIVNRPVRLLGAVDEIAAIVKRHPRTDIVMKIDCEGAEYGILDSMFERGILTTASSLVAIIIEWHQLGPQRLIERLAESGFFAVSPSPRYSGTGMVYATRVGRTFDSGLRREAAGINL